MHAQVHFCEMSSDMNGDEPTPLQRIRIVLSRTSHPGNIGAAARAMKTMGLSRLYLVAPKRFPNAQADAMAVGATDLLSMAVVCPDIETALADCVRVVGVTARRRELSAPFAWAREAAADAVAMAQRGEVALLFGNETSGLANDEIELCQQLLMIPTNSEFRSLNLAAAVQIVGYELRLAAIDHGAPPEIAEAGEAATQEDVDRLVDHLERVVIASGFLDPAQPKRLIPRMRRMFARAGLEREEVNILRGMLASFEKKVD
jgi:tRNA/rRNA methyltransferase